MKNPLRLLFPVLVITLGITIRASAPGKEELSVVSTTTTTVARAVTTTTPPTTVAPTTTTTVVTLPEGFFSFVAGIPANVPCQEWAQTAYEAGWPIEVLPELLWEVWSESRCLNIIDGHKNFNGHDRGPLQINQVWLDDIEAKYGDWTVVNDPRYNFAWGWEMYRWYEDRKGCGFIPWSRPCK